MRAEVVARQRAQAALETGRYAEAERFARQALAAEPGEPACHALLARALLGLERREEALRAVEAGLAEAPDSEWLLRLRASVLRTLGRPDEALGAVEQALALAPELGVAHYLRAVVLHDLGRGDDALAAVARAIALEPDDAGYRGLEGDLLLERDAPAAERAYRESLRLDPEQPSVLNNLGVALERQRRHEEARVAYRSAVLLDPGDPVAKRNTHASVARMLGGGATAVAVVALTRGASLTRHLAPGNDALAAIALVTAVSGVAGWFGYRAWKRRRVLVRIAAEDPSLHALYVRLEADRKARRL